MRKLFSFLLIAAILLSSPVYAARGFGTTFGVGTTDSIKTGYATLTSGSRSYGAWVWFNASIVNNRIFSNLNGSNEDDGLFDAAGAALQYQRAFATSNGIWSITTPSSGTWHHILVTYNGSSTANIPTIYVDGVSQSVTTTTAPIGGIISTSINYYVGNTSAGTRGWDGKIAEFTIWNGVLLSANEALALFRGVSPLSIRRGSVVLYLPLYGTQANEQDWGPSHVAQIITGTKQVNHPHTKSPFVP